MKKAKYEVGDTLYWFSVIEGKVIGGKVKRIIADMYVINVDGSLWEVNEYKLSKRKSVKYKETSGDKIMKAMGW